MLTIKEIKLNDGILVPMFAYCTARPEYQQDCSPCVKRAYLDAGVTHFDTGEMYGNEDSLGRAVRKLEMPREEVVIVTKCNTSDPRRALERSLHKLGMEQVDLYLIHGYKYVQETGLEKAWKMMEDLRNEGKARSIGVANYRVFDLEETMQNAKVIPSIKQIEMHPYVYDTAKSIIEWCHDKGITMASYTTLASITNFPGGPVDAVIKKIAEESNATEDQITYGGIIVTTLFKKERLQGQIRALSDMKELSDDQVLAITDAGKGIHQRVGEPYMDDE